MRNTEWISDSNVVNENNAFLSSGGKNVFSANSYKYIKRLPLKGLLALLY